MESPFFGEILILFLLILNCSRMFFLRYGKVDSLTVIAPLCVFISVLQIIAWGADFFSVCILIVSIFAFFTNFRALLRFMGGLFVDHYSLAFKTGAFLVILFSVFLLICRIIFRPTFLNLPFKNQFKDVLVSKTQLSGSFALGFEEVQSLNFSNNQIKKYESTDDSKKKFQSIVILQDKRANLYAYEPLALALAQKGYTVYLADFFAKDLKWLHSVGETKALRNTLLAKDYFKNPVKFESEKEFYSYNISKEAAVLLNFVELKEKTENSELEPIFVIGDWMAQIYLEDLKNNLPKNVSGVLNLTDFEEFSTPGFGFADLTNPLFTYIFKLNTENPLESFWSLVNKIENLIPPAIYEHNIKDLQSEEADENELKTEETKVQSE